MKKIIVYQFLVVLLTACIGEDFIEREQLFPERLRIVSENSASADSIKVGDTLLLTAEFINSEGKKEAVDFIWESSNLTVAVIQQENELIGIGDGVTIVTVRYKGLKAERLVVVDQLERIELSVSKPSLRLNETLIPIATYYNQQGVMTTASVVFSSSNTTVAIINGNNELEALQVGQTNLTATFNGISSNQISISVVADTLSAAVVELSPGSGSIMVGETLQLNAVVKNTNGNVLPNASVVWASSNANVLNIDNNGWAMGVSVGSSDVTASSGNATSVTSSVLVNPRVITARTGNFMGRGSYTVNGSVTMSTLPNGSLKLDFENFSSSTGPGLYIYLSNTTNNGISIETLNRRSGNFTVNLPSNIAISDYNYVLIWCQPFGLTFGSALLN